MPFFSPELRRTLDEGRRDQQREWAARTPDERLEALCRLRALALACGGDRGPASTDETPELWRAILRRRRAARCRSGAVG